jgi:RNA polymerase sigma factor (sigma-70 family)
MMGNEDSTIRSALSPDVPDLVRAAQQGDETAVGRLFGSSLPLVAGWVSKHLGAPCDDVVQETMLSAYLHLPDLRQPERFGPWLSQITENCCHKWIGRRKLERLRFVEPEAMVQWAAVAPSVDADVDDNARRLHAAMSRLSPNDRTAATLYYFLSLPQKVIARVTGVPEGTIKSRLNRVKSQLQRSYTMPQQTHPNTDAHSREIIGGTRGIIRWQSLLDEEGLAGWQSGNEAAWTREDRVLIGGAGKGAGSSLRTGSGQWEDYELSLLVTPISGGNAQILFRIDDDGHCFYLFDMLLGWQAAAISLCDRRNANVRKLSVVNFAFELGREYHVLIAARGASLTTYIDGKIINQLTDTSLTHGPIALNVWESQTAFRDPRIRLMH